MLAALSSCTAVSISDNMTGDYYYGAVTVNNGAVFKMYGGSISGNQCISTGGAGGVYVYGGTFEMYGGTITDNTYIQDDWSGGGGVSVNSAGTFTMSGGTITNNTASGNAKVVAACILAEEHSMFPET